MKLAFCHPDLGLGGAERLIVDAAVALQNCGHNVTIYTSHHDREHAFVETTDGTLSVKIVGDSLPRHFLGKLHILFATLRGIALALYMLFFSSRYDVIIVDQLSAPIPILRWTGAKILFYCHFPDKFLSPKGSLLRKIYRYPFDKFEEYTTLSSHSIVVNSKFTATMFREAFSSTNIVPAVLYPSINFEQYDRKQYDESLNNALKDYTTIISINRFERKKNVGLAIEAFAQLKSRKGINFNSLRLVIAGGYDTRVIENVEHLRELQQLARKLDVETQVMFIPSFSNEQRATMFERCSFVAYTPSLEHFGIVPIEAMYAARPVVACNSGGPVESVLHQKTGLLVPPLVRDWADAFESLLKNPKLAEQMGNTGKKHVMETFSLQVFTSKLDSLVRKWERT